MAVEAAVNRLEALVEKIDADLNYAVLKLSNGFDKSSEDGLRSGINPVRLIERLQKAKQDFRTLMKESDEIETNQKTISQELSRLTSDQIRMVNKLQLHTGMQQSSTHVDNEEFRILHQECVPDLMQNTTCRSLDSAFQPVTENEFMSISDLVRGRSKLEDVNQVYDVLFTYFQKNRKASCLTLKEMTKLGLKVTGATGNAKLKVLKTLKIIDIGKDGSVKML
ncbi:spindle and kinetochore-associated protein 2-like isoform X2 [Dendronephthya gigantea]|uniref:spindle and kinetochore-associated protein 2-like isoform X2 n=1 Tax=Dendronephthya gigantea TaxID=151771 RepID=UPI00106ACA02|nr:spindle and kinetochore-associated protein 2-like isoform X2 [Dendronephthya gigantea]